MKTTNLLVAASSGIAIVYLLLLLFWRLGAVGDWAIGSVVMLAVAVSVIGPLVLAFVHARMNADQ